MMYIKNENPAEMAGWRGVWVLDWWGRLQAGTATKVVQFAIR
jgi:hypothetical protein